MLRWASCSPEGPPLLRGPPAGAEPESPPLHGHYSPSATRHCVLNLTNELGSSHASPRGSYATGGGCYPACRLACLLLALQTPGTGWAGSSASSGSPLCRPSPLIHPTRGVQPAHLLPGSFPCQIRAPLVRHSSPSPRAGTQPCGGQQRQLCAIPPCPLQSLCASSATDMAVPRPNRHLCTHGSHQCCTLALGQSQLAATATHRPQPDAGYIKHLLHAASPQLPVRTL